MDINIFQAKNPWRNGQIPAPARLERPLFAEAFRLCREERLLLLFGPRMAGKTTLLKELARRLIVGQEALPKSTLSGVPETNSCRWKSRPGP